MLEAPLAFGPFHLDRSKSVLLRNGSPLEIGQRAIALLKALVEADGQTLTKAELMEAAWPDRTIEEGNISVQVSALRRVLGRTPDGNEWIVTVPRVGYRLSVRKHHVRSEPKLDVPSIAVLPFANLSGDPEQAFFGDGMVEDLITALSRFKTLTVIARNSTLAYRDRTVDVRKAASELGVSYVLEGSVRRVGMKVRVTAQLIDGSTGAHLWADHFEGKGRDLFDFQDGITESVIGLVEPRIRRTEIERARRKHPDSLDAWGLYVRSLPLVYGDDPRAHNEAIELLHRAIELDPGYGPALALCSWAHEKRHTFFGTPPAGADDVKECLALAARALEVASDDAKVLAIAGWMQLFKGDWETMFEMISRAVELNPNDVFVLNWAGMAHYAYGKPEDAIPLYERALQLSPRAPDTFRSLVGMAMAHFNCQRYEDAITWARRSAETPNAWAYHVIAAANGHLGRFDEARAALAAADAIRLETIAMQRSHPIRRQATQEHWVEGLRKAGMPEA